MEFRIERSALTDAVAVKRVAVVAEGGSPLRLNFSEGSVLLRAGYEDDVASQRLPAVLEGADDLTVAFNPTYLMDALGSFDTPVIRFELMGPGQRAVVTGRTPGDDPADRCPGHQHLLMSAKPLLQDAS